MRYLIVSDLHGSSSGMRRIKKLVKEEAPDTLIILGDILHGAPDEDPSFCSNELRMLSCGILAVKGNCDHFGDEEELGIELPYNRRIGVNSLHSAYLMHHISGVSLPPGDMMFFGHTHVKTLFLDQGVVYFNPGSIALPRDGSPGYGVLDERGLYLKDASDGAIISSHLF